MPCIERDYSLSVLVLQYCANVMKAKFPRKFDEIVRIQHCVLSSVARKIYRGYNMAARGYEFYLRALKVSLTNERSERMRDTSAREDKIRIPKRSCNVLFTL